VPVGTPTVMKNPVGKTGTLPVAPVVPGETTREQMEAQYKAFAVDSGIQSLFWGRFRKSKWAVFGGIYGVGAAGGRLWGAYNLLATFDDSGTLKALETVPEDELLAKLVTMQKTQRFPVLDLSQPVLVSGMTNFPRGETIDLQLSAHEVVITKTPILRSIGPAPHLQAWQQQAQRRAGIPPAGYSKGIVPTPPRRAVDSGGGSAT